MGSKKRKKRSLRGKIFLTIAVLILILIIVGVIKLFSFIFSGANNQNGPEKVIHTGKTQVDSKSNDTQPNMSTSGKKNSTIKSSEKMMNNSDYSNDRKLAKNIIDLVMKVPFNKDGTFSIDKKGTVSTKGLDSYGLVDYTYACATGKHLSEVNITKDNFTGLSEIERDELQIGDIGVCMIGNKKIYGVYVGESNKLHLFAYSCDLSNGIFEEGGVYLSYNRDECNNTLIGFPLKYEKFYRLPNLKYHASAGCDVLTLVSKDILPSQSYINYSTALYKVGEWFCNKDMSSLLSNMNKEAIKENGYKINEDIFKKYVNDYITDGNFLVRMVKYEPYKGYATVHGEVELLDRNDRLFEDSGITFDCTIYDDGRYLPGVVFFMGKYASMYGYIKNDSKDDINNSTTIAPNSYSTPSNTLPDSDTSPENYNQPDSYTTPIPTREITNDEDTISGNGFSIDLNQFYPQK